MKTLLLALALLRAVLPDIAESAAALLGASGPEELDASELERFEALASHPLEINLASRSRLLASGLFSPYQVASIVDWRSRTGDILSFAELAAIDGIGERTAGLLRPFLSLASSGLPPGQKPRHGLSADGMCRETLKDGAWSNAIKLRTSYNSHLEASAAIKDWSLKTANVSWTPASRCQLRIVAGDFGARFGQGLLLWSGFSLSGFSSVASFCRSGSGIVATNSLSGASFRGVAAEASARNWTASVFCSAATSLNPEPLLGLNLLWYGKRMQFGVSGFDSRAGSGISADFRVGTKAVAVFAEVALDPLTQCAAAVAGCRWTPSYGRTLALLCRSYDPEYGAQFAGGVRASTKTSDESGVALGLQLPWMDLTLDKAVHPAKATSQTKAILAIRPEFSVGAVNLKPQLRLNGRIRPEDNYPQRYDIRADVAASVGGWQAAIRYNAVSCRESSWMSYAEAGWSGERLRLHLRASLFKVDRWEDRIYVYERDAPGNFNVPVCYGRGWRVSFYGGFRGVYLRASGTFYPWCDKEDSYELKLQYVLRI